MKTDLNNSIATMEFVQFNSDGSIEPRLSNSKEAIRLADTLFGVLFPGSYIASLKLPSRREVLTEKLREGITYDGRNLLPIGSRASKKNGTLYLVEAKTQYAIAERFRRCGEALLSHFDLFMLPCTAFRQETDVRIGLTPQSMPGVHDWRASIRRSLLENFDLPMNSPCQFVMSFAGTQAVGEVNVMEDGYADREGVDILLPKRAVKPLPASAAFEFRADVVLGIGPVSESQEVSDSEVLMTKLHEHVCTRRCNTTFPGAVNHLVASQFRAQVLTFSEALQRTSVAHWS